MVKEWTVISIEVCVESPFIPPHWADGRGRFQGRLALAQPRAHHQITQLHLRLLNLCWSSSLTLWAPQACWFHRRFPDGASPWRTLHVCPGTDSERQWDINISVWSKIIHLKSFIIFIQTVNILQKSIFVGPQSLLSWSALWRHGRKNGLTGVTVLQRQVLFRHFEEDLFQGGVHHPKAGQGQAVQALL